MKRYLFILMAAFAATACEHDSIYQEIDFGVTLASSNTYRVGEPVRFEFSGNADYLLFFSGETGHEYCYRDRYSVDANDIEKCIYTLQLNGRSGKPCMTAYVTNNFAGLNGADEAADLALITSMINEEGDLEGWTKIEELNDPEKNTEWTTTHFDVTHLADNFAVALHWNPTTTEVTQRNYWVSSNVEVQFKGYDPQTINSQRLNYVPFAMNEEKAGERYILTKENSVNYTMRYTGNSGLLTTEFVLTGCQAYDPNNPTNDKALPYAIDCWVISTPMALNLIEPDTGVSIKTLNQSLEFYDYTFEKPGTYTVSFVATSGNYIDQSRDVKEFTITIVDPLE